MKLVKLLANLGYGSRKDVQWMFREGRDHRRRRRGAVRRRPGRARGDPRRWRAPGSAAGLLLMLHKPVGYTCSTKDPGRVVYDLLPPRFRLRSPLLSTVGAWIATRAACCC
jgi:16S rRNA pseudouridine516 synthase